MAVRSSSSFFRSLRNAAKDAASLQPRFAGVTQNILVVVAVVLMMDAFLLRDHLAHPHMAPAANIGSSIEAGVSALDMGAIPMIPEAASVALEADRVLPDAAFGLGVVGMALASLLFLFDTALLIGATLHRFATRLDLRRVTHENRVD